MDDRDQNGGSASNGMQPPRKHRASESTTIQFPESGWTRTPRIYDVLDLLTEVIIYVSILFGPWAFGTTQAWAIQVMNGIGYSLGLLFISKWVIRMVYRYRPHRWGFSDCSPSWRTRISKIFTAVLAILTVAILTFCFISAWNARANYVLGFGYFDYFDDFNKSLPHSYDAAATWSAFYTYLALACFFWSMRDWLLGKSRRERHAFMTEETESTSSSVRKPRFRQLVLPERMKRLLWVISCNAALLSMVSIIQRLDGGNKLLWLLEPRWNKTNESQFGPYAYRSNAAQYLNLAWPLCLGFWWASQRAFSENFRRTARVGQGAHVVLLPMAIVTAIGPLVATSRGGVLVSILGTCAAIILFTLFAQRTNWVTRIGITVLFSAVIGLGAWLGWEPLQKRLAAPTFKFTTLATESTADQVSIFTRFTVPAVADKKTLYIPIVSPLQSLHSGPKSLISRILFNGELQIYLVGTTTGDYIMKYIPGFTAQYAGQEVEMLWVKTDDLAVYINGDRVEVSERKTGNAPSWSSPAGVAFLWNGIGNTAKASGGYISRTQVFTKSIVPSDISLFDSMPDLAKESGLIYFNDFAQKGLYSFLNADTSGRDEIFKTAQKIFHDFPLFGSGPGSFPHVNSIYMENSYQYWHSYAHDDYLETLATFGIVGFSIIMAMLLVVLIHWFVGSGIFQYFPFAAMILIGIGGCLAHAKFDFPFQVYSILHIFLINCCLLMTIARKA